jgi:hypothetical protein
MSILIRFGHISCSCCEGVESDMWSLVSTLTCFRSPSEPRIGIVPVEHRFVRNFGIDVRYGHMSCSCCEGVESDMWSLGPC